ncbi:hypothetical protein C8D97_11335 [Pleionea mediterranea]|uniref:4Fe-4S ferredoxin-type domain-containing protein n=2 Tax=Pleionea mediterranea TaxID=523701 RepID=A0A316FE61_9GAMM|nr:hypothetical protein C8D97_11335 [Pleionea mediterranea]
MMLMQQPLNTFEHFQHPAFAADGWHKNGLNMQHVFDRAALPENLLQPLAQSTLNANDYNQVILIASAGKTLWRAIHDHSNEYEKDSLASSDHPVDEFSQQQFNQYMSKHATDADYKIIYPKHQPPFFHLNLQSFGELAGWHHSSPFKVGINSDAGSWFAYRLLVLANSSFEPSTPVHTTSPCKTCIEKPCVSICPAKALTKQGDYDWQSCFAYRKQTDSLCRDRCLARMACPIAKQHQYSEQQIQYHYNLSRKHLR